MSGWAAFRGLVMKEVYHILRDRRTLFVVLAMPVVQMILFGYALQTDVEEVRLLVVDPAPDPRTREVVERFRAVPEFRIVEVVPTEGELPERFARGDVDQALVLEADFGARLRSARGASALVVTDAASPVSAPATEAFAVGVLQGWARDAAGGGEAGAGRGSGTLAVGGTGVPAAGRVEARTHFAFNPTLESKLLFVPGLLAFILTIISALMTAITVAREKESGTLELLLVSPLEPAQIIPGKVVPYLGLAFLNAISTLVLARVVFQVPFRGSLLLLLAESVLYVAVCLALGVLISVRTPTQRTAMLGVILSTVLPTAILSGMIFPVESMPGWLQPVTYLVPARWFIDVVRGIMLKDAGLGTLWLETTVLVAMTAGLMTASVRSFRARLG